MIFKGIDVKSVVSVCVVLFSGLAGCGSPVRQKYEYQPAAGDSAATLTFRSTTSLPSAVDFYISEAAEDCKGFRQAGYVFDHQRERYPLSSSLDDAIRKIIPIKKLQEVKEFKSQVVGDRQFQIQGLATYSDGHQYAYCGPLSYRFTPAKGGEYIIDFKWLESGACIFSVQNSTDPSQMQSVAGRSYNHCKLNE